MVVSTFVEVHGNTASGTPSGPAADIRGTRANSPVFGFLSKYGVAIKMKNKKSKEGTTSDMGPPELSIANNESGSSEAVTQEALKEKIKNLLNKKA